MPTGGRILLGSNSPRRRELLQLIVPEFTILPSKDVDETYPADLAPADVPLFLSRLKARAYFPELKPGDIAITADTVVILDGKIMGKPADHAEAIEMLNALSGQTHQVVTGVTLTSLHHQLSFSETTCVEFGHLSPEDIAEYVGIYNPIDKAGAYGIQEWIGCIGIKGIQGCFYNVMGLPLHTLHSHLLSFPKA